MPTYNPTTTGRTGTRQSFTVPASGPYRIEVVGAAGGEFQTYAGGKGARMIGTFTLTAGDILDIVVGQKGLKNGSTSAPADAGSGGGGSFVWKRGQTAQPLIAAGGGGGEGVAITASGATRHPGIDAVTGTNGNNGGTADGGGTYSAGAAGGANGSGGSPSEYGAGGAGWLSSGGESISTTYNTNGGIFPLAASDPAFGGFTDAVSGTAYIGVHGGYGGGGASFAGGGGGGGYSGGGGGGYGTHKTVSNRAMYGGGGGSYNSGTDQANTAAYNTASGLVVITQLNSPPTVTDVSVSPSTVPVGDPLTVSWIYTDPENNPQVKYQFRWRKVE